MALISEVRTNHMSTLLSSLEDMMTSEVMCDFTIKVGDDDYPVHRVVLAGTSKYFKAMFSSGMKEAKEGFSQMFGMKTTAMKRSIDFMYTGTAEVEFQTVENTLSAATLLQLDGLAELCFHFLETHIAVDSCLLAVRLSNVYGRESLKESAVKFLVEHFADVVDEPNFPEIPKEDLIRYIKSSNANHEMSWRAVVAWMTVDFESKKSFFQGLLRSLNIEQFPFEFFHEKLMNESMLQGEDDLKAVFVEEWFSDFATFIIHLSTENYYNIKSLIADYSVPNGNQYIEHLAHYFAENFKELSQQEEFLSLCEEEILPIFQSKKNQLFPEKVKWNAAVEWVKFNESRMKTFPILFESINLDLLPGKFIEDNIYDEALVKESNQCKDALLKYLCRRPIPASHITCLSQSSGEILTFNPEDNNCQIITVVPDGIGISNVKGDLYLVTRRGFYRLNRNGSWTVLPSPPRNVEQSATVLHLRQCVYIIGRNSLQWFNPVTNAWLSRDENYQSGLSSCQWSVTDGVCFTVLDDALYQLGGHETQKLPLYQLAGHEPQKPQFNLKPSKTSNLKPQISNLKTQKVSFSQFGGHETQNPSYKLNSASALSSEYSTWVSIASMNVKRAFASAEVLRGAIWIMGGGDKSVETYHPVVNVWTMMAEMVFPRERFGACVVGERLFAVGGAQRIPTGFKLGAAAGAKTGGFSFGSTNTGFSLTSAHQRSTVETTSKDESFMEGESVEAYEESRKKWRVVQTVKKLTGNISCCSYSPPPEVRKLDQYETLDLKPSPLPLDEDDVSDIELEESESDSD